MIEVHNLSKFYGRIRGVENLSFSIADGEIVGFLGPNGAGKTTTFRILTCYHPASSGSARVAGHDVFSESLAVRRQVGYLPESVPLYPEMRVREYLRFRAKLRGLDRAARERSIANVAERCWIRDVINRPIGQLSKGYRQRVGLADALLHNPRVLILDEPTVGLDPVQIRETGTLIRELAQAHTVMLSSHILPQVEATCRRMIIIHRGRIIASGTLEELRARARVEDRVIAEIQAPVGELRSALERLDGVRVAHTEPVAGDGVWTRVSLAARGGAGSPGGRTSESVFRLTAERSWPMRELRREVAPLEEVFVRLIEGAGGAEGGGGSPRSGAAGAKSASRPQEKVLA